ncbi:hypothetical protein BN12_60018 [Nostocoides japonicum T1-X7]|uniref:Uncharacterized protein n=1 Tax=Nostocoides japonicum T1-X7 TaxID=1194083 RepID=A0A077M412_9MICO|nr:hypothetical protein BN12_60018 [Tetrasphaera japonica T1-X7]
MRRLLIESAWHHEPRYAPGTTMHQRWAAAPSAAAERGDSGNRRLHRRWQVMTDHKVTVVAVPQARSTATTFPPPLPATTTSTPKSPAWAPTADDPLRHGRARPRSESEPHDQT